MQASDEHPGSKTLNCSGQAWQQGNSWEMFSAVQLMRTDHMNDWWLKTIIMKNISDSHFHHNLEKYYSPSPGLRMNLNETRMTLICAGHSISIMASARV